jgi:hypothetical protein
MSTTGALGAFVSGVSLLCGVCVCVCVVPVTTGGPLGCAENVMALFHAPPPPPLTTPHSLIDSNIPTLMRHAPCAAQNGTASAALCSIFFSTHTHLSPTCSSSKMRVNVSVSPSGVNTMPEPAQTATHETN